MRTVTNMGEVVRWRKRLDAGEAATIALALELKAEWLHIDEWKSRNVAKRLGLGGTGTLGLLICARMSGHANSLRDLIALVETQGDLYLSQELKESALAAVGE